MNASYYLWHHGSVISGTLLYLICGTLFGWTPRINRMRTADESHSPLSESECRIVSICMFVGAAVSTIPAAYLSLCLGRKRTMILAFLPFTLGWILIIIATTPIELYIGQILGGMGIGISLTVCPIYLLEIAETQNRGKVIALYQTMVSLGILFEYVIGTFVSYVVVGCLSFIPIILFLVTFIWMPETPFYYLMTNNRLKAGKSLSKLRGESKVEEINEELDLMELTVEVYLHNRLHSVDIRLQKGKRRAYMIVLCLLLCKEAGGFFPMLSTSTVMFNKARLMDGQLSWIILAFIIFIFSILTVYTIDLVGRRLLLMISGTGSGVSLLIEGIYFYIAPENSSADWIPLSFFLLYIIFFTLGLGPVLWVVAAEVIPFECKDIGMGILVAANIGCTVISLVIFYTVKLYKEDYLCCFLFSVSCFITPVWVWFYLPETKCKTLAEIYEEINE